VKVVLPYDNLLSRYPQQVKEVVDKVNSGGSRLKQIALPQWEWSICYNTSVDSLSYEKLKDELQKSEEQIEKDFSIKRGRSLNDRIDEKCKRCFNIRVFVSTQGFGWESDTEITSFPSEIITTFLRKEAQEEFDHDQKFLSMSPEARKIEVQQYIKKVTENVLLLESIMG